jgi:hypothetical protein
VSHIGSYHRPSMMIRVIGTESWWFVVLQHIYIYIVMATMPDDTIPFVQRLGDTPIPVVVVVRIVAVVGVVRKSSGGSG